MNPRLLVLAGLCLSLLPGLSVPAGNRNPDTDWFSQARYGVFVHFLPSGPEGLRQVEQFDEKTLAAQLESMGAAYLVLTLGQNSGYFNAPNETYSRTAGYAPGERCSRRDLPLDLHRVLAPRGIRLLLYLPCQTPNQDPRAQKAFGLPEGPKDQPLDPAFAARWADVIQEWSDRYGDKVSGWWFDGAYQHVRFDDAIADRYAAAARHGNPMSIVTFNPGVKVIRWTRAEDYTAGELNEPFSVLPADRWLDGSQWHALTYLGSSWGGRNVRFEDRRWIDWARQVVARRGVITLDLGPNYDAALGPVGSIDPAQVRQVRAIRAAIRDETRANLPPRRRRADSFFGIHFDFHAGPDCTEIGRNTTPEMVEKIIAAARPDYLQIDCKGHPGLSSYPTRVGNRAPGFVGDPLRVWREVTARHGVALYLHYSGVWDSRAIELHPDWGAVNADGKINGNATSFFSPYADRLLIPQLRELAGDYGVDGAWVDGECWASVPDFGEPALEAFRKSTGIQTVPRKPGDPYWQEFLQFHRDAFRAYLRRYIAEVKLTHPDFQLCSNWAFTDHMPEPVSAPVDWISGDFSPQDAVNSARFSGRYLAHQGKPWDLMAWSFVIQGELRNGSRQKNAAQIQREAAVVLAQGGGFQFYYNQRRDGSVPEEHLPVIAEVARFCRERQPFCEGSRPVPQIAFLYSTASHYREINSLFGRDLSRLTGTLQALVEGRRTVDVVGEHVLAKRAAEYPLIVVGECDYLEPAFRERLVEYVRNGGSLLLVGPQAASLFTDELDVTLDPPRTTPTQLAWADTRIPTHEPLRPARLGSRAKAFGTLVSTNDSTEETRPAASIASLGKGRIAATYLPFSRGYLAQRAPALRAFLNDLTRELFPQPLVEVTGADLRNGNGNVDVSVNRLGDRLAIHLVNTSGPHWDGQKPLFASIEPVGPLQVAIRTSTKPGKITVQPGGTPMDFDYRDGIATLAVPSLDIHRIIVIE